MGRKRKKRHRRAKPKKPIQPASQQKQGTPPQQKQGYLPFFEQLWRRVWKVVVGISVFVSLISGLMILASHVNVSSVTSLNPSEPFSTLFFVSNDGLFSIYDVEFGCDIGDVTFENNATISNLTTKKPKRIPVIEAGEKDAINCPLSDPQASKNSNADVAIVVSYKPRFLPYRKEKKFRFISAQGSDEQWQWLPQPLAK